MGATEALPRTMAKRVELIAQMSLQRAVAKHQPTREMAKLRASESAVELMRVIQFVVDSNRTAFGSGSREDRSDASREFWALGPLSSRSEYAECQVIVAAVVIAAEHKLTRKLDENGSRGISQAS